MPKERNNKDHSRKLSKTVKNKIISLVSGPEIPELLLLSIYINLIEDGDIMKHEYLIIHSIKIHFILASIYSQNKHEKYVVSVHQAEIKKPGNSRGKYNKNNN